MFQYDNVFFCHRATVVLTWFENNDRRKMLCPPQSPDVNPIKNIRSWTKEDTGEVKPTTCEDIKAALFKSST